MPADQPDFVTGITSALNLVRNSAFVGSAINVGASPTLKLGFLPSPATSAWAVAGQWVVSPTDSTLLEQFFLSGVADLNAQPTFFDIPVRGGSILFQSIGHMLNGTLLALALPYSVPGYRICSDCTTGRHMIYSGAVTVNIPVTLPSGDPLGPAVEINGDCVASLFSTVAGDFFISYIGPLEVVTVLHIGAVTAGQTLEVRTSFPIAKVNIVFISTTTNASIVAQCNLSPINVY